MAPENVILNAIEDFLALKRIALVGISRNPREIGFELLKALEKRGYSVVCVNPRAAEILGRPCFDRVQNIQPPAQGAILLTPPSVTNSVVRDCADAGIHHVWLFRGGGLGSVSPQAVEFCERKGITVIPGECPFMFLKPVRSIHWVHRWIAKLTGHYPHHQPT